MKNLLKTAVFEDDRRFAGCLESMIRKASGTESAINTGGKADMLRFVRRVSNPVLFFLDILDEHNATAGFDLADEISHQNRNHLIVFLTGHPFRIIGNPLYQTRSFNLIFKNSPTLEEEVIQTIHLAAEVLASQCMLIRTTRLEHLYLPYRSICYLEHIKGSNRVCIHCVDGEYLIRDSLVNLMEQLDARFVRCHNSFIVNRDNIRRIDKQSRTIFFSNGSSCFYSFLRRGELGM